MDCVVCERWFDVIATFLEQTSICEHEWEEQFANAQCLTYPFTSFMCLDISNSLKSGSYIADSEYPVNVMMQTAL